MITKEQLLAHKAPWKISKEVDEFIGNLSSMEKSELIMQCASMESATQRAQPYVEQYSVHITATQGVYIDMPVEAFYVYLKALRLTMRYAEDKQVTLVFSPLRVPVLNGFRFVQYKKALGIIAGVDLPSATVDEWFMNNILPLGV